MEVLPDLDKISYMHRRMGDNKRRSIVAGEVLLNVSLVDEVMPLKVIASEKGSHRRL